MTASAPETKTDLEHALLRAQIQHFEGQDGPNWFKDALPAAMTAVVLVIGALAATSFVSSYWQNKVQTAEAELSQLDGQIGSLREEMSILLDGKSQSDNGAMAGEPNTGFELSLGDCSGSLCAFTLTSTGENARFEIFGSCTGTFSVPGSPPDFGTGNCQPVSLNRVCSDNNAQLQCRYGPFAKRDASDGWWVRATSDLGQSVRYLSVN